MTFINEMLRFDELKFERNVRELKKMPKPITPLVGCEVFVVNDKSQVLLIKRSDNGFWAMPGGCHDLGETPRACAIRECLEESGFEVKPTSVLGVFSSNCYLYENYPWKENEFCHILFRAEVTGGAPKTSSETTQVQWFAEDQLPPLSDGHGPRIKLGFLSLKDSNFKTYFE
jgi:ADP-ribose pyrophosphatase YjhB (NUDIX family)